MTGNKLQSQTLVHHIDGPALLSQIGELAKEVSALKAQVAPPPQLEYITRKEVAAILKVSLVTVNDWRNRGILTCYKIGNQVRYKRHEVEAALVQVKRKRGGSSHE